MSKNFILLIIFFKKLIIAHKFEHLSFFLTEHRGAFTHVFELGGNTPLCLNIITFTIKIEYFFW